MVWGFSKSLDVFAGVRGFFWWIYGVVCLWFVASLLFHGQSLYFRVNISSDLSLSNIYRKNKSNSF